MAKGMIHNKDLFLNQIANKLGRERKDHVSIPTWKHQPQWEVSKNDSPEDLLAAFRENSKAKNAEVVETDKSMLLETIQKVIKEYGGGSIVTTKDARFAEHGITSAFDNEQTHIWDTALGQENIKKAKEANLGIFFSDKSLAESGTVVQFNDKDIARSVSLLPITYVAIVPKSSIVPRMTQVTREIHKRVEAGKDLPTCVNFISGPSNSADIEMDIVVGVHGPVKAVYLLVVDR
ncbi:LutC/YkgG family protein [Virgibacillus necropolis]|uniref:Lactate utilization protein C n=1 Tax=Virgibacillus necropolis TaxID=163877 RepID=A0A221M9Z7_9BACI|nr:lactate utilization protein C [Virgibacillus necropolis]ASN04467.1 lactate utilization protein C [Virgibacillus necropolis]